jgi:lipoprotein-anchoring transpeptidase ErfK/SrfK
MSRALRSTYRGARLFAAAFAIAAGLGVAPAAAEFVDAMRVASIEAVPPLIENTTETPGIPVTARIDLSDQTMHIYVGEKLKHVFRVSTGRGSYRTPTGKWNAEWLSPKHRSRKYNNAPMPWAVFFYGGYAVHGTTDIRRLGRPASHGCVRLHPDNAKVFYSLVRKSGKENTLITVVR